MTLPATAQEIYDLLSGDEAISDALGAYTLPGGDTLPAISVLAGGENLPPGTVTGGIEITITAVPNQAEQLLLSDEVLANPTWRIYVIAWGALGELQAVRNRIIALLPGATSTQPQADPPGEGLGVVEQVVIRWTNPCVLLEVGE
jgi:hypothetical protein